MATVAVTPYHLQSEPQVRSGQPAPTQMGPEGPRSGQGAEPARAASHRHLLRCAAPPPQESAAAPPPLSRAGPPPPSLHHRRKHRPVQPPPSAGERTAAAAGNCPSRALRPSLTAAGGAQQEGGPGGRRGEARAGRRGGGAFTGEREGFVGGSQILPPIHKKCRPLSTKFILT